MVVIGKRYFDYKNKKTGVVTPAVNVYLALKSTDNNSEGYILLNNQSSAFFKQGTPQYESVADLQIGQEVDILFNQWGNIAAINPLG